MIYLISDNKEVWKNPQINKAVEKGEIAACTEDFFKNWLESRTEIEVDTETTGLDFNYDRIFLIQIGDYSDQFIFDTDVFHSNENWYHLIKSNALENPKITCILQNALFDLCFFYKINIFPKNIYDTMLAEWCLHLGYKAGSYTKSLDGLTRKYLGISLDKSIRATIDGTITLPVIKYAADDVKYLGLIKKHQLLKIQEKGLKNVVILENRFVKALAYITVSGIKLNTEKWRQKCIKDKNKLTELKDELESFIIKSSDPKLSKFKNNQLSLFEEGVTCGLNFSSPTQVVKLFDTLGLDLSVYDKTTGKNKKSVEADVLMPQIDKHPLVPIYMDFKSQEKVVSTYGENWLKHVNPKNNRITTKYTQMLDTGRLSSGGKDSSTGEEYINFLNIPQDNEIRNCIIPDEGKVFIDCDYTGQETVIFAEFSQEPSMIDFLNNDGGDMHSFIASKIYPHLRDVPLQEIKANYKKERQAAKAAGFAIQYGGVGATIAKNLSIPIDEGDFVYNSYMEAFPEAKKYFEKCKKKVKELGYIKTNDITNRRIHFSIFEEYKELNSKLGPSFWEKYKTLKENNPDSNDFKQMKSFLKDIKHMEGILERSSLNFPIQSTAADMTKIACIYIFEAIIESGNVWKVLMPLVIHDQIVLEVPESDALYWSNVVKDNMIKAGNIFCKSVKIKAEPEILKEWKK